MLDAGRDARAHAAHLTAPVLILHGGDDDICFPSGSTTFIERAGSADKTLEIVPGGRHEVLQEPTRHESMARILAWLDERVPAAAA
jgi:alpha-beta hydrolase superfamily lysophospholipase